MKSWISRIVFLVLLVAGVGSLVYAFLPQPVIVNVATIRRGPLSVTVDEDGKTRIKERYVVSSPLSGRLLRIGLDPGDEVRQGETLVATIEPTAPELLDARALAQARAKVKATEATLRSRQPELNKAQAAMEYAESERERIAGLFESEAVTQREFEQAELLARESREQLRSAKFAMEIARFELELAKAALLRTTLSDPEAGSNSAADSNAGEEAILTTNFQIHSPISGRVLRVFQESSTVLTAGSRLLELGDPTDLEVEVDVLSKDAVKIEPGASVHLEQWGGSESLTGAVRLIEPQAFTKVSALGVEEQRVNVIIDFRDAASQRKTLGDGYRIEARIVIWSSDDVLLVPTSALFREGEDWVVFVINEGRAETRRVEIGRRSGLKAEVIKGLEIGESVIVHPGDQVRSGVAVEPR